MPAYRTATVPLYRSIFHCRTIFVPPCASNSCRGSAHCSCSRCAVPWPSHTSACHTLPGALRGTRTHHTPTGRCGDAPALICLKYRPLRPMTLPYHGCHTLYLCNIVLETTKWPWDLFWDGEQTPTWHTDGYTAPTYAFTHCLAY